jgi:hypothetical protein
VAKKDKIVAVLDCLPLPDAQPIPDGPWGPEHASHARHVTSLYVRTNKIVPAHVEAFRVAR